jgi:polyhydroxybutyrate depolymerase
VADVDDVAFARALVAHVQELACIDASRVYAVGVLTGGGMAHYLGCHAADVFAGIAPAAFDLLEENVDGCAPARPISVVSFRGNGMSRVPYEGGPSALVPGMPLTFLGAQATFEAWAALDGCSGPASAPDANGCSSYSGCAGGVEVVLCTQQGGAEDPGDPDIAWPVLQRHTL